jgi:hypothetical protein
MLRFSIEATKLKTKFYGYYNEIDVFVEDEGDERFYEKLLDKIIGDAVRIKRVFGVGGKVILFRKVNGYVAKPGKRKAFFIADGDFDRIIPRAFPATSSLYVLEEYCIENFLFEDLAICNVIQEEILNKKIKEIQSAIKLNSWLEKSVNQLTPVFATFILIQKYNMGIPNVDVGLGTFLSNSGIPRLDSTKVKSYIATVKRNYHACGNNKFEEEIALIENKMGKSWRSRKRYICGKNYLMPLLRFEVKRCFRRDIHPRSFRFRIMNKCRFGSLSRLGEQIRIVSHA